MSKRGRPTKLEDQTQVALRLPQDMLDRVDRYQLQLSKTVPGVQVTRADAFRALLTLALDHVEGRRKR
jgi:hypothetical protein